MRSVLAQGQRENKARLYEHIEKVEQLLKKHCSPSDTQLLSNSERPSRGCKGLLRKVNLVQARVAALADAVPDEALRPVRILARSYR